ncbi:MAG: hypothetical protein LBI08_00925 [Methanomassiliicoccaceae archaeon]|jgi:hypothetical protein|nr:hypothetical protein [Methanomassiliicoccaceae archaeon]
MRLNEKGEGGFTESIVAVMVVVISLTAFLSFLAFSVSHDTERGTEIPLDLLNEVYIVNGNIVADIGPRMVVVAETYGFAGMRVTLTTADSTYDSSLTLNVGHQDTDNIRTVGGTIIVRADDGRSVPVNYWVAVWS